MCFIGCLGLFVPRIALLLLLFFAPSYLYGPIQPWWLVIPGWLFLPYTSLAYAFAVNTVAPAGEMGTLGWVIVAVAILLDVSHLGGGARWGGQRYRGGERAG